MSDRRVAMVCPYSLSRPGGVQGQVQGLARALGALGIEVVVIAPDDGRRRGLDGDLFVAGPSTGLRANGSVAPVSLSPAAAHRALQFTREGHFDLVHLHEPMAPALGYALIARSDLPMVGTYHRSGDSAWYRVAAPLARWANRRLAVRCAVSQVAADTVSAALGGSYEVLFNGVEIERLAARGHGDAGRPAILFLGRHEERKGLEVLLEAFGKVPGDSVLWVAGDGPQTTVLRRRFPPSARLEWLGVVSDDDKRRRLADAVVLCAPSLGGESFGMVLVEAMASRCVVVASDIPGYRAAAGGHATLVRPGNPAALGAALVDVLGALAGGTGPGAPAALDSALAHAAGWSMDALAGRYGEIYDRILGSAGGGARTSLGRHD